MNSRLPDVTSGKTTVAALPLRWVGMEQISLPIKLACSDNMIMTSHAKADVFVSLDKAEAKGIHMSRLYLKLKQTLSQQTLTGETLNQLLNELITSQQGLTESAKVNLNFELTLAKPALLSDTFGYQTYPITLERSYSFGQYHTLLTLEIPYSSTCPCSAALSRQALSDAIEQQFEQSNIDKSSLMAWLSSEQGSVATPHSQRSYAYIKLTLKGQSLPNFSDIISELEQVIGTPVQTAVKREDEQAFAKLNADNLMFCEDAARRVKHALEHKDDIIDYWFKIEHQESLHAHNAVVIDHKE